MEDIFTKKSLWQAPKHSSFAFFCPQCKTERRISYHPRPTTARHIARVALTTAFVALLTWKWVAFKGVFFFFPLWAAFELFYRTRVRAELSCRSCGFDPYLYLTDVKKARAEIETFWRKKFTEKGITYPGDAESPASVEEKAERQISQEL
jgi:hypothetical protein